MFVRKGTLPRRIVRAIVPVSVRYWLRSRWADWRGHEFCPGIGRVRFGDLRKLKPISADWGFDRGLAIDRHYIETFLSAHASDIHGHVLEFGSAHYTRYFGGNRATKSDVLHSLEGNPRATIVADLTSADNIPSDIFDCIICTQTIQLIYDQRSAVRNLYRILKPGGVLLLTTHGISKLACHEESDPWGEYWHMTTQAAERLLKEFFPADKVQVHGHGNVLAAIAFLHGLAAQDLRPEELDYHDHDFELLITIRAVKPEATMQHAGFGEKLGGRS